MKFIDNSNKEEVLLLESKTLVELIKNISNF